MTRPASPIDFFAPLKWLDGRPLLATIEPYRRKIFVDSLYTFDRRGTPVFNLVLCGRGKKNWKTADLVLAALYRFLAWPSNKGSDTFLFAGFDEIHAYKNHDLFEALAPDPSRPDALIWITSYAGIRHAPGIPLHDFMQAGKRGEDERMYFSWYAGDFTTDSSVRDDATPEERANPSMISWGNDGYLAQQKKRLPSNKYRRLHLNLPGAPDGAAFDGEMVVRSVVPGRKSLPPEPGVSYRSFVDMSGGSSDDATLGIAHAEGRRAIVDLVVSQTGKPRFNPRDAVRKFAAILREYRVSQVCGDSYSGETFKRDFEAEGISYKTCSLSKSDLYEAFEPRLNAGEIELPDVPKLAEQLLTLVISRSGKIDHQAGDHDDFANAAAGAVWLVSARAPLRVSDRVMAWARSPAGSPPPPMSNVFVGGVHAAKVPCP
jgi:hypothetical protein